MLIVSHAPSPPRLHLLHFLPQTPLAATPRCLAAQLREVSRLAQTGFLSFPPVLLVGHLLFDAPSEAIVEKICVVEDEGCASYQYVGKGI